MSKSQTDMEILKLRGDLLKIRARMDELKVLKATKMEKLRQLRGKKKRQSGGIR